VGLTTLPSTATLDDACDVLERDGGVILSDFVDAATHAGLDADLQPVLDNVGWGQDDFAGNKTRRLGAVFKHTRYAAALVQQPLFYGAAQRYLQIAEPVWFGEERAMFPPTMQIGVTQVIQIHPGEGAQPLHRDDAVWQWRHPAGGRQARVQIMFAVTDFTAANGGTLVIPGSHKWDDDRQPLRSEAVPTEMQAGSALLWFGGTYHAGGTNQTDRPRTGVTITLDLGYLRQEENHYLAIPRDVVKQYPENIQRLLGYEACPPFMGWVEVDGLMSDPHVVLEEGAQGARALSTAAGG
jgi:ectoine hydroxylase-related dioxygenase (phytanoyl-CoA dioxygenase family)